MENIIEEIYNEIEKRCKMETNVYGYGAWDHHIKLVYEIARKNYKLYDADLNIVSLSALLHDIASVTNKEFTEDHHIIGAKIADELLSKYDNINKEQIEHIKKCILNHRGSRLTKKTTPEEICLADSDALAHFYSIPSLLKMAYVEKGLDIDNGAIFVLEKLGRSYNKLSSIGKSIIKDKYEHAKSILKNEI